MESREVPPAQSWSIELSGATARRVLVDRFTIQQWLELTVDGRLAESSGMRRFIAALVACAGLLGVAAPALACAAAALAGDCCPPGETTGCGEPAPIERIETPTVAICCISASVSSPILSVESVRKMQAEQDVSSPEPLFVVASLVSSLALDVRCARGPPTSPPPLANASLTYLHTGRLRL